MRMSTMTGRTGTRRRIGLACRLGVGRRVGALYMLGTLAGCAPTSDAGPTGGAGTATAADADDAANMREPGARFQPGADFGIYAPEAHPSYDGRFVVQGSRVYQVGTLADASPWDHLGDDASNVRAVSGTIDFDVNERTNTGSFRAALDLPEGHYVVELDRFEEFSPCQDGGIAAFLYEHGNAGCGDANWPKSLLYVAGWGWGSATLDGAPLHDQFQIHFMVTQGMRDRATLRVLSATGASGAGAVNPAQMQLDFYIRSPAANDSNRPTREVFDHFFAMDVTWR